MPRAIALVRVVVALDRAAIARAADVNALAVLGVLVGAVDAVAVVVGLAALAACAPARRQRIRAIGGCSRIRTVRRRSHSRRSGAPLAANHHEVLVGLLQLFLVQRLGHRPCLAKGAVTPERLR